MTLPAADFEAYLARIGWEGPLAADRATLEALVRRHTLAIPFENLAPFLADPVELGPDALVAKLVRGGRGGYCFEQNGLLWRVLQTIGFDAVALSARVKWLQSEETVTPRTHMLLLVRLPEAPVIVDVGFGGAVLTGVLDLVPDVEQPTPHEHFRLIEREGEWRQQIRIGDEWRTTYAFDLHLHLPIDYEAPNWWTSTNPRSHFTNTLIAARPLPGRRLALRNSDFAIHHLGGDTERRAIRSADEACDLLEGEFGLTIDRPRLERRIAELMPELV